MSAPETTPNSCTCGSCACESAWQPIETARDYDMVTVCAASKTGALITTGYRYGALWYDWLSDELLAGSWTPTHWRELPKPPTP
jgi:hypothetical protein